MNASIHQLHAERTPAFNASERFITKSELASHLGFSTRWINQQLAEGLPHYKIGGRIRFQLSTATAWLVNHDQAIAS